MDNRSSKGRKAAVISSIFIFIVLVGIIICVKVCSRPIAIEQYASASPVPSDVAGAIPTAADTMAPPDDVTCTVLPVVTPAPRSDVTEDVTPTFTVEPTMTAMPMPSPTPTPVITDEPTAIPTAAPTAVITAEPTVAPTAAVTSVPTAVPTAVPTVAPTAAPTPKPTSAPSTFPIHYSDATCRIDITKEWYHNAWCYIAHLQFTDYTRFGSECANGRYGGGYETTSHCANRIGAMFCVNGDYSAPNLNYAVVRQGHVWNDRPYYAPGSYNSHNGVLFWSYEGSPTSGQMLSSLVSAGKVTDSFTFGPDFLRDGKIRASEGGARAQRTFMGTNGQPGDIWIVVADGRYNDGESSGLTGYQCAALLKEKGCTFGIPLDGGGSSTMVWNGRVLNAAKGHERAVVDFIFFR